MNPMMQFLMQSYGALQRDPLGMVRRRFNIPQDVNTNDPNEIVQYLLNSGQVSQQDINSVMGLKNDPRFSQIFGRR